MLSKVNKHIESYTKTLSSSEGFRRGQLICSWRKIVGPAICQHALPYKISFGSLLILCSSSAWSHEILMQQKLIIQKYNELFPSHPISRLCCKLGKVPQGSLNQQKKEKRIESDRELAKYVSSQDKEKIDSIAGNIQDLELRQKMAGILTHIKIRDKIAVEKGAKPCIKCKRISFTVLCKDCLREMRLAKIKCTYQIFGMFPWLKKDEINSVLKEKGHGDLTSREYWTCKNKLASQHRQEAWIIMNSLEKGQKLPEDLRALLIDLVLLETSLPLAQLSVGSIKKALRPRLSKAYLEDSACPGKQFNFGETAGAKPLEDKKNAPNDLNN